MPGDPRLCLYRSSKWGTGAALPSHSSSHCSPFFKRQAASLLLEGPHMLGACTLEAGRLWAGPDCGSLGRNKGSPEAGMRDAQTSPLAHPHGSLGGCGQEALPDVFSIRMQPSSFCFIHLFQRTSSKPVYTGHRKEITAHNHHADSLSFQSSSLKPGGGGDRSWRKNKNSRA